MFIRTTIRWQSRDENFVDLLNYKHRLSLGHTVVVRLRADLKERSAE